MWVMFTSTLCLFGAYVHVWCLCACVYVCMGTYVCVNAYMHTVIEGIFSICLRAYACAKRPGLPRACHSS